MRKRARVWGVYVGIFFFIALLLFGINTGEYKTILEKATKICLSCIGLG